MKLRMYLRGLGLGMIVTALVLSFGVKSENKTMTDAEVRARAKELGMVEESEKLKDAVSKEAVNGEEAVAEVTDSANEDEPAEEVTEPNEVKADGTDKSEEPAEVKKPEATKDDAGKPEEVTEEPIKECSPEEKVEDDKDAAEIDNKKEEIKEAARDEKKSEDDKSKKPYNLTVERGYSSDRVAGILEDAGVIDNAAAFDRYLCSNGYDKRISVGSYQIPAGADYSTVAKLITNSN